MSDLQIRSMTPEETDLAIDWAAAEGWNPGLDDRTCFLAEDPGGFLMGTLDGAPVAVSSAIRYGGGFGFIGFYIAKPEMRGKGLGIQVWNAGMARLAGRRIGLDGVVDQQPNYRKSGFELAHRNIRQAAVVEAEVPEDPRLRPVDVELAPLVTGYDREFFAGPRETFLECWLRPGEGPARTASRKALALVEDGAVTGYGVIRACREGAKIGPLFADRAEGADALFRALAASRPAIGLDQSGTLYLDTPEPNPEAVALARRYGLEPVFETARMYTGGDPGLPTGRTFGITTFELG